MLIFWISLLLPAALFEPSDDIRWFAEGKRNWANCYLGGGGIHFCDQSANFVLIPDPERTHLQEKLDYLKENQLDLFADLTPK
jgi:hypothetical protein